MKLRLTCVAILLCIAYTTLSSTERRTGSKDDRKSCMNSACKKTAEDLRLSMDLKVQPCEDFYKYTCGNFVKEAKIPEGEEKVASDTATQIELNNNLKAMFEKEDCDDCPHYERYLKDYYKACTRSSEIEDKGEIVMLDKLREFGEWPFLKASWDESKANLTNIMTAMLKYQIMDLFELKVYIDERNSSFYKITMTQQSLTFPIDYYVGDKHRTKLDALKNYISNTVNTLSKRSPCETETNVQEVMDFEGNLSMIMEQPEILLSMKYEPITLRSLADNFTDINMTAIVVKLFRDVGIQVDGNEELGIYGMEYFNGLAKLLNKTPKRTVINYLFWKLFNKLLIAMPQKYEIYTTEFEKIKSNISELEPRWKRCISLLTETLYKPLGAVYAKKYFNQALKNKTKNLIGELKNSFESMIRNAAWLTETTKKAAINKLKNMREYIGYPDYYDTDETLFVELFDKIKNSRFEIKDFLRQHFNFLEIAGDDNYKLLRSRVDPNKPDMEVAVVNAVYELTTNTITFPAGILNQPFFSEDIPMSLNYGAIGTVIGHEITHGFDNDGHQYDEKGTLSDWWAEEDKTKYADAAQCMLDIYSEFVVEEINENINGNLTLGENIADNGGLRASFMAYKTWKINNEEFKLPGFNYTQEQLFFIGFGRMFCEKVLPDKATREIREDPHAPSHYRINGAVQNMGEFSKAFNCPPKSPMNPEKKCKVW